MTPKCALSYDSNIGDVIKRVKRFFDGLRKSLPQRLEFYRMTITKEDKTLKSFYTYYLNRIECCNEKFFSILELTKNEEKNISNAFEEYLQLNEPNEELTAKSSIQR